MSGLSIAGIALVLGLLIGVVTVMGAPYLAIPIVLLGIAGYGFLNVMQRGQEATDMRKFREEAQADKTDFTARDAQTQVEDRA